MTGPAPRRSPRSRAERKAAKFSDTRLTPRPGPWRGRATMSSSLTPGSAVRSRRIRSSDMPSAPQGTNCRNARMTPSCRATTQHAVGVDAGRRPGPGPSRSRARSRWSARRRRRPGPRRRSPVGHVADPADLGGVAGALDPLDHLAHVAHRPALEGEVVDVDDRLVAELERGEPGLAAPDLHRPSRSSRSPRASRRGPAPRSGTGRSRRATPPGRRAGRRWPA